MCNWPVAQLTSDTPACGERALAYPVAAQGASNAHRKACTRPQ